MERRRFVVALVRANVHYMARLLRQFVVLFRLFIAVNVDTFRWITARHCRGNCEPRQSWLTGRCVEGLRACRKERRRSSVVVQQSVSGSLLWLECLVALAPAVDCRLLMDAIVARPRLQ